MDTIEAIGRLERGGAAVVLQVSADDLRSIVGEVMRSEREAMARETAERKEAPALSRKEAAELLHCSLKTLYTLDVTGELKPVRLGARVLYRQCDIDAFLSRQGGAGRKGGGR